MITNKRSFTRAKMTSEFETNYSNNSDSTSRFDTFVVINCVLNASLMLTSITSNALVLTAILRTPSLHSPSIILLGSLAVSDLLVGLVVQPIYIAGHLNNNDPLSQAINIMAFASLGVSLSTITAITVDRFLSLHYHMQYPNLVTTRRAVYTSVTLWFIFVLLSFTAFWSWTVCQRTAAACIISCLLVCTVCFIRIYRIVRQHQLQIHIQQQAVENLNDTEGNNQHMLRSAKSAKTIFIYYIVMILCYTPLFSVFVISSIFRVHQIPPWTFHVTIAFMNSSINPFLYCWRLRELRTAVVKTAKLISCKEAEGN